MTVSELSFGSNGLVGFCACCGLRRPLGTINDHFTGEQVRCIDCFFGPPEQEFVFVGTAVLLRDGRTGDVVRDWHGEYFEPHGDYENRFSVERDELYAFKRFQPNRHSVRVEEDYDD